MKPTGTRTLAGRAIAIALAMAGPMLPTNASAADAVRGKSLYANTNGAPISCGQSSCHGADPAANKNKTQKGANNGPLILSAISGNKGGMGFLGPYVNSTDAADIGIWAWNFTDGSLDWDTRTCALYGVPEEMAQTKLHYDFWRSR
ncbi:MAG TPA: hypothetical protein PKC20_01310, partial [Burkholderiaceae bacterium]|nr:hypothetical protein [Burkholderiaceae bacterium]